MPRIQILIIVDQRINKRLKQFDTRSYHRRTYTRQLYSLYCTIGRPSPSIMYPKLQLTFAPVPLLLPAAYRLPDMPGRASHFPSSQIVPSN